MSKILRRPMFRGGGKVSSYGNGIATGLADGGMPGKRGLVDGPGGYAGEFKTGSQVFKEAPGIFGLKFDSPFLSMKTPANRVGGVKFDLGQSPSDFAKALSEGSTYRDYLTLNEEEFETETTESGDVKFKLDTEGNRIPIESDKGSLAELIEKQRIEDITMQDPQGELGDKETVTGMEEVIGTNILDERDKKIDDITKIKDVSFSDAADGDITTVDENDLSSMIDNYEKILLKGTTERNEKRLKKARIDDLSNLGLNIYSKSTKPGANVKTMLGEAAEDLIKKPSKTEIVLAKQEDSGDKIRQAAAMLGIKGEQAQKLYETKLKNKDNSGQLQKAVEYIKAINPEMDNKEALATYQRRPASLSETVGKYKKQDGVIMPSGITLAAGEWFSDDYKGELPTDGNIKRGDKALGKEDGAYTDKAKGLIFVIEKEVVTSVSKFEN